MYYDYPIEQLARSSTTRFQMGFARLTMHLMPQLEDVALEPSTQGLKILAANEMALQAPCEIICQIHVRDVELRRPRVRLRYDTAVREPIMWVRAAVDARCAEQVLQDLIARNAEIEEVDWREPVTIVRAKAPPARLSAGVVSTRETHAGAEDVAESLPERTPGPGWRRCGVTDAARRPRLIVKASYLFAGSPATLSPRSVPAGLGLPERFTRS